MCQQHPFRLSGLYEWRCFLQLLQRAQVGAPVRAEAGSTLRNEGYVVKILKIVKELGWVSGATIVTKEDDEGKAA